MEGVRYMDSPVFSRAPGNQAQGLPAGKEITYIGTDEMMGKMRSKRRTLEYVRLIRTEGKYREKVCMGGGARREGLGSGQSDAPEI
jgi:hypothetical protein